MNTTTIRLYLALDPAVARRLLWVRRDARQLPRAARKTVRVPVLSMSRLVYGSAS